MEKMVPITESPRPENEPKSLQDSQHWMEFMECDSCRGKSGTPTLCRGCLHNREVISKFAQVCKENEISLKEVVRPTIAERMTKLDHQWEDMILSLEAQSATGTIYVESKKGYIVMVIPPERRCRLCVIPNFVHYENRYFLCVGIKRIFLKEPQEETPK